MEIKVDDFAYEQVTLTFKVEHRGQIAERLVAEIRRYFSPIDGLVPDFVTVQTLDVEAYTAPYSGTYSTSADGSLTPITKADINRWTVTAVVSKDLGLKLAEAKRETVVDKGWVLD